MSEMDNLDAFVLGLDAQSLVKDPRIAELERQLAEERERLDWWEEHLNYQHGEDYEDGDVIMYKITGNINDREWHEVARAKTLREVLDKARRKG